MWLFAIFAGLVYVALYAIMGRAEGGAGRAGRQVLAMVGDVFLIYFLVDMVMKTYANATNYRMMFTAAQRTFTLSESGVGVHPASVIVGGIIVGIAFMIFGTCEQVGKRVVRWLDTPHEAELATADETEAEATHA